MPPAALISPQLPLPVFLRHDDASKHLGTWRRPADDRFDLRLIDYQTAQPVLGDDGRHGCALVAILDGLQADFLELRQLAVNSDRVSLRMGCLQLGDPIGKLRFS